MKNDRSKMSVREWRKTPEGKKEMLKRAKELKRKVMPELEKSIHRAGEMIRNINRPTEFVVPRPASHFLRKETLEFLEYRDGNFYTRDKLIDFRSPKSNYALMLKALLVESDESGFLSYEDINKFLERSGKGRIASKKKQRNRISNAIATLKRDRGRQKNNFPNEFPDGTPVIRTIPGKGLMIAK